MSFPSGLGRARVTSFPFVRGLMKRAALLLSRLWRMQVSIHGLRERRPRPVGLLQGARRRAQVQGGQLPERRAGQQRVLYCTWWRHAV